MTERNKIARAKLPLLIVHYASFCVPSQRPRGFESSLFPAFLLGLKITNFLIPGIIKKCNKQTLFSLGEKA